MRQKNEKETKIYKRPNGLIQPLKSIQKVKLFI